jgi:hypothetical protein
VETKRKISARAISVWMEMYMRGIGTGSCFSLLVAVSKIMLQYVRPGFFCWRGCGTVGDLKVIGGSNVEFM